MIERAVVLAAGLGSRLRPLTRELPKPLVPVGDRPLLQHIIEALHRAGVRRVSINAFHLSSRLTQFVDDLSLPGLHLSCDVETKLLGTAGGLRGLTGSAVSPVLVWNADIYAPELPLETLLARAPVAPLLVVAPARRDASVGLDHEGRVVRLREERFGRETVAACYIGIAVLPPAFLATLPEQGCLVADALLPWLRAGMPVSSLWFDGFWSDGGTADSYLHQNLRWLAQQNLSALVGEGAEVATAVQLEASIVGPRAVVTGHGSLTRCVVWPGARVVAPLRDTVVMSDGTQVAVAPAPLASSI